MNEDIEQTIYEMWCEDFTEQEIADFLFEDESNYNNADKSSNQPIESYEEILGSVKDCIANNESDWIREKEEKFQNQQKNLNKKWQKQQKK